MNATISDGVWARQQLSGNRLVVMLSLARSAGPDGVACRPVAQIAADARIGRGHTRKLLRDLVRSGELDVLERGGSADQPDAATSYRVLPSLAINTPYVRRDSPPLSLETPPTVSRDTPPTPKRSQPRVELPLSLDTPKFRQAWDDLQAYRRERRLPAWKDRTIALNLANAAEVGPEQAAADIRMTIQNGWNGLFFGKAELPQANNKATDHPESKGVGARWLATVEGERDAS